MPSGTFCFKTSHFDSVSTGSGSPARRSHLFVNMGGFVVEDGEVELHQPVIDVQVRGAIGITETQADAALPRQHTDIQPSNILQGLVP